MLNKLTGPVIQKTEITQPLESQIVKENESTILKVEYNKPPETQVQWMHNGKTIEATFTDEFCSILEIHKVDKTRVGTYSVNVGDICSSSATIRIFNEEQEGEFLACFNSDSV